MASVFTWIYELVRLQLVFHMVAGSPRFMDSTL